MKWIKKIEIMQVLFFLFSFVTFFTYGINNSLLLLKAKESNAILLFLIINIICFFFGKIYGNLLNKVPLRLISYIFLSQAFLSLLSYPKILFMNIIAIFVKSFLSGIPYSIVFSLMSNKTEKWKIKKYIFPIVIFASTLVLSNIFVYFLSNAYYISIILELAMGIITYKVSSNDVKIEEIIEDKDKLTDFKVIINSFLNSITSLILFVIQKEKAIILYQFIKIVKLLSNIVFFMIVGRDIFFCNISTYYYIGIISLKYINKYIKNETLHGHIQHIANRLEAKMFSKAINDIEEEIRIINANNKRGFFSNIVKI
jgi:hypothetical protein